MADTQRETGTRNSPAPCSARREWYPEKYQLNKAWPITAKQSGSSRETPRRSGSGAWSTSSWTIWMRPLPTATNLSNWTRSTSGTGPPAQIYVIQQGRIEEALADCNEVIRLDPTFGWGYPCAAWSTPSRVKWTRPRPTTTKPLDSIQRTPWFSVPAVSSTDHDKSQKRRPGGLQ